MREAVRRCVLDFKAFRPDAISDMATEAGIPEPDRDAVVTYVGQQLRGLHEGNVIRYRLQAEDLAGLALD